MSTTERSRTQPVDAVAERLNDPAVAASLVTLLDNAELLSTLVLGLSGMVERSEMIMDSLVEGLHDVRSATGDRDLPSFAEVSALTTDLVGAGPALRQVLGSSMVSAETISLLTMLSDAANEGAAAARRRGDDTSTFKLMKAMRDDDVQRGIAMFVEIARALGRRLDAGNG